MSAGNPHFDGGIPQWFMEDVLKIFNGTYQYWDEVPGCKDDGNPGQDQIVLVGRDSNSGTRASFEEITGLEDDTEYADIVGGTHPWQTIAELNSNGAVHDSVATDDNAIGYIGLGYVDSEVDTIDLYNDAGVPGYYEANVENIKNGDYPIARKLYLIYKAPLDSDYQKFIDWVKGSNGQAIVEDEGFIRL
jgi:phosphate transport system substrate-binding protein